jgi:hypothetical protein
MLNMHHLEEITMTQLDDGDNLALSILELCIDYGYTAGAVLNALPPVVGEILRDYPEEPDRDGVVLELVQVCAYRRSALGATTMKRLQPAMDKKLKPLTDTISAMADQRIRNAFILELIYALTLLGDI